ncbi:hypothetical protein H4R34_001192 [Dimargaris verticillata]|uniref:C2 domain-containing protein n=1 Tax=Dimargaris verticillata TaxID=2761393 RepID=A0A9W8BBV7_9FUNG|nr:hypothetical protein H4R34_001192 [Dimargaris verticillata]
MPNAPPHHPGGPLVNTDAVFQALVCAVLHDYLTTTATAFAHWVNPATVHRRRQWLQVWHQVQSTPSILTPLSHATTRSVTPRVAVNPKATKSPLGKASKLLAKARPKRGPKGLGSNHQTAPKKPTSPPMSSATVESIHAPEIFRHEITHHLLDSLDHQLDQLQHDRRTPPASAHILRQFRGLLAHPGLRADLQQRGAIEDLIWLYGKVILTHPVLELGVHSTATPLATNAPQPLATQVSLVQEMASFVSLIKIALSTLAATAPGPYTSLLHRVQAPRDWSLYVIADAYEVGGMTQLLAQLFQVSVYQLLRAHPPIDPMEVLSTYFQRFEAYHTRLTRSPVPMDQVNHLYSPSAYQYWLAMEQHNMWSLLTQFQPVYQTNCAPQNHFYDKNHSPHPLPTVKDPHQLFNQLCQRAVDLGLRDNDEQKHRYVFAEAVQQLLTWCGLMWCISAPYQTLCYVQAVFDRVARNTMPAAALLEALTHFNALLEQVPHRHWSHFDNDTAWACLQSVHRFIEQLIKTSLQPIDFYPCLEHPDQLPLTLQRRVRAKWQHLNVGLACLRSLSINPILLYYQPDVTHAVPQTLAAISTQWDRWYDFWWQQFVESQQRPGQSLPSYPVGGMVELASAITVTVTLSRETFGIETESELATVNANDTAPRKPLAAQFAQTCWTHFAASFHEWVKSLPSPKPSDPSVPCLLDIGSCLCLHSLLLAVQTNLDHWKIGIDFAQSLANFSRLYMAHLVQSIRSQSQQWVDAVLRTDQPLDLIQRTFHTSSADDILCCLFEPFDLLNSVTPMDTTLRTWAVNHLFSIAHTTLQSYSDAMKMQFLAALKVVKCASATRDDNKSISSGTTGLLLSATLERLKWNKCGTSKGSELMASHPHKVYIEQEGCRPLNNLHAVSQRLHDLATQHLPPTTVDDETHALAWKGSRFSTLGSVRATRVLEARQNSATPQQRGNYSVRITVVHGEGLDLRSDGRPRHPYVKLAIPTLGLKVGKTTTKPGTRVPRWAESFNLWVSPHCVYSQLGAAAARPTLADSIHQEHPMTLALYDRDKPYASTLVGVGKLGLDPKAMKAAGHEVWVAMQPKGKVLVRLAMETSTPSVPGITAPSNAVDDLAPVDARLSYTNTAWYLRQTLDDLVRQTIEAMVPYLQHCLTRQQLLGRPSHPQRLRDKLQRWSGFNALPSTNHKSRMAKELHGYFRPLSMADAAGRHAKIKAKPMPQLVAPGIATGPAGPLDDLFEYLNGNLAVLYHHTHPDMATRLVMGLWQEIVIIFQDLMLPPLPITPADPNATSTPPLPPRPLKAKSQHLLGSTTTTSTSRQAFPERSHSSNTLIDSTTTILSYRLPTSKPRRLPGHYTLSPDDLAFVWECLDAIQWFFHGSDSGNGIPNEQLEALPEYVQGIQFIRTHYPLSIPQLIRAVMHTKARQLDLAKQWQTFAGTDTAFDTSAWGALVLSEPTDPAPSSRNDSPQAVTAAYPSGDEPLWLKTHLQLIFRILLTRMDHDPEVTTFLQSHWSVLG